MPTPGIEVEDTLSAIVKWESGAMGTITASTACNPGLELSVEISGDSGTAILVNDRIDFWKFKDGFLGGAEMLAGKVSGTDGGASNPMSVTCAGHRRQIQDLCNLILGEGGDFINGREASHAVSIVEAAYRSVKSGKAESISYLS